MINDQIKSQSCHHIETNQLIYHQLTSFYMMTTLAFNELKQHITIEAKGPKNRDSLI